MATLQAVAWIGETAGHVRIIDQTLLPTELSYRDCHTVDAIWEAIRSLRVRGAPAIGVTAAFGVVLGVRAGLSLGEVCQQLRSSRPTAVNLFWALDRMDRIGPDVPRLLAEARAIQEEDCRTCAAIGAAGAPLIRDGMGVLTHCNTGALATAGIGTALAVITTAHEQGCRFRVYADETRPLLQGARLTAWELVQQGVPVTLICDNMAAQSARIGSPPTATRPTRLAPTAWQCWPGPTAFRFTWRRRSVRLTFLSRTVPAFPSRNEMPARSRMALVGKQALRESMCIIPPSTSRQHT